MDGEMKALPTLPTLNVDWLPYSIGINLPGTKSLSFSKTFDFSNYDKFSIEIWYRSATDGTIFGFSDDSGDITDDENTWLFEMSPRNGEGLNHQGEGPLHQTIFTFDASTPTNVIPQIYYDGVQIEQDAPYSLPTRFWGENIKVTLAPNDNGDIWKGEIFKFTLYNSVLTLEDVSRTRSCLPNSKPHAPNITQHVFMDTMGTIQLNGAFFDSLPSMTRDHTIYSPHIIDVTRNIVEIEGEKLYNIGTSIYDIDEGSNGDFWFKITQLPKSKLIFDVSGGKDVILNEEYGPAKSLVLNYQSLQNAHSWSYASESSTWKTTRPYASFIYQVYDGVDWSNFAHVKIVVDPRPILPTAHNKNQDVQAGSTVTFSLSGDIVQQFEGRAMYEANQAIISHLPVKGTLNCCIAHVQNNVKCADCPQWKVCQKGSKINPFGLTNQPCIQYSVGINPLDEKKSGQLNMYKDKIMFQMLYGNDNSVFSESSRIGEFGTINLNVQNPFNPTGNAPLQNGACVIVEDEKSVFDIDFQTTDNFDGQLNIKIMKLPSTFKGTLYVGDEEMGNTSMVVAGRTLSYLSDKNAATSSSSFEKGYTFDFVIYEEINGKLFESPQGQQQLCVAPRNDKPEIKEMSFYIGGQKILVKNGEQRKIQISIESPVEISVEWEDVDRDYSADYKIKLEAIPVYKSVIPLSNTMKFIVEKSSNIQIIDSVDDMDASITFKAKYDGAMQTLSSFTLEAISVGEQEICLTIEDLSTVELQNENDGLPVKMCGVIFDVVGDTWEEMQKSKSSTISKIWAFSIVMITLQLWW